MIPFIKTTCPTSSPRVACTWPRCSVMICRLSCFVFILFCLLFFLCSCSLFFFLFVGLQKISGGRCDRILTFPSHCALRFGRRPALSALSRARSHLQQIPVSRARMHFAKPDDCGWKMNYSAGLCLTDGASCDCTRVKEAVQRSSA